MKGAKFLLQRPPLSTRSRPQPAVWPLQGGRHRAAGTVLVLPVIQSFVPFLSDPTGGDPRCSGTGKVPGAVTATPETLELAALQTADVFGIFPQWAFQNVFNYRQWMPPKVFSTMALKNILSWDHSKGWIILELFS